jgi:hypothetical protein
MRYIVYLNNLLILNLAIFNLQTLIITLKLQATSIAEEKKKLIMLLVNFLREIGLTVKFANEEEPGFCLEYT